MKKLLLLTIVVFFGICYMPKEAKASDTGNDKKPLVIIPSSLKVKAGKTTSLKAKCTVEKNAQVQELSSWSVMPDSLGNFDLNQFNATTAGVGVIVANYKDYSDTIAVEVLANTVNTDDKKEDKEDKTDKEEKDKGKDKDSYPLITFEESRVSMAVGETYQLAPVFWAAKDSSIEVSFEYGVDPVILGSVSAEGLFSAEHEGNGKIYVTADSIGASLKVKVKKVNDKKDETYPKLEIATKRINIKSGEYAEMMAVYTDSTGEVNTVNPLWSVEPELLGHFVDSLFYADSVGKGFILANYEGLSDSIPLNVQEPREYENIWSAFRVSIVPADTVVAIGDSVQFSLAVLNKKNWQLEIDSTLLDSISVDWSVVGHDVGTIDEEGVFTASANGFALIKAKINGDKALTTRIVVDQEVADDSTGINTVEIQRVLPNGNILPSKTIMEGSSYKIGGLPFPLNILNGGLLHFPVGSLKEDIEIFMMLPDQAEEDSSGVILNDSVVAGVRFIVVVGDSVVEPYYFETPLILSIPYKEELLDSLGIEPDELGMFFSNDDGSYSDSCITNIVLDTLQNRIIADVEHFSSLVIRKSINLSTDVSEPRLSAKIELITAPNPFIDYTKIQIEVENKATVQYLIYDITGKQIRNIDMGEISGKHEYTWDATDNRGEVVRSGIYFGQLILNGNRIGTNKMIKLGL